MKGRPTCICAIIYFKLNEIDAINEITQPSSIHIALLKQVTSRGTCTAYSSGAHVFYTVLCQLLLVFLPILSWLLYCLAFDLRVLITLEIYLKVDICSIFLFFFFYVFLFLFIYLFCFRQHNNF